MHQHIFTFVLLASVLFTGCSSKSKLERHIQRADAFYEEGEFDKARIEYLNAFRLANDNAHVNARLGESFLKEGDAKNGFQFLGRALALQPTNNEVRVKVATMLLLAGNAPEAREQAVEVLKNAPLHPDALLIYVNASLRTNELVEARARLESLAAANPSSAAIHLGLGTLAQRTGARGEAETSLKKAVELEPKSVKGHFALGSFYFQQGDTNNAGRHFKTAMDLSPLQSVERLAFAEFLLKTGQRDAAEATINEATSKHPEFAAGWNMLTQIAFAQNDTNKAAEHIANALAKSPRDRDALLNQARLKLVGRDFKAAIAILERLSNDNPKDSQALLQLAVAQFAAENATEAFSVVNRAIAANTNNVDAYILRARLQMAREDWNSAIPELNQLVRRFPRVPQVYYLLGSAQNARGNREEAAAVYTAITKNFPNDPQGFQMLGRTLSQQEGKLPEARRAFENALKVNPDYLAAIDSLTDLDIAARQFEAATNRINVYLQKYPKSPLPPLLLSKVLFRHEKNEEAEAAVQKAIALEPEFMAAHRALADFYVRTKQTDKALAKFESIVAKDEKDVGSRIQLGMLYEAKADFPRALQTYESVLKLRPTSVIALNNIAYLLSEQMGKVDQGFEYARRAREANPLDPHAADTFGWILWKKGQYAEALSALRESAESLGDRAEVQYHIGMAHYMLGDIASAKTALISATQSTNDFPGKDLARGALAILQIDPRKSSPASLALAEKHIANHPKDAFAHVQLARLYEAASDSAKAREAYEKALSVNSGYPIALAGLAGIYAGTLNQPERAMEFAHRAWNTSPTFSMAAALGPLAYQAGDYRWANGRLLEAARAQPSPEILFYKALASYSLGFVAQARDELSRVTQSSGLGKDNSLLAKNGLELVRFHLGQGTVDEAARAAQSSLSIDAQFVPALLAKGIIAERKNDLQTARAAYESALKQRPNLLVAQRQLAILLGDKMAEDDKAYQLATALRQDLPEDPALAKVLGKIAYRRADYREAIRHLNNAASGLATDSDVLYHLGMAQYRAKDQGAKASLTKAISLNLNANLAAEARKALAELK